MSKEAEAEAKKGGLCCGCFCDYRRAVIVMAIITLISSIVGLAYDRYQATIDDIDDDQLREDMQGEYNKTAALVAEIVNIVLTIISLVGAWTYNKWMVLVGAIWPVVAYIWFIISVEQGKGAIFDIISDAAAERGVDTERLERYMNTGFVVGYITQAILRALWAYPSVFLFNEIRNGIMSAETYPREKHSCCCA